MATLETINNPKFSNGNSNADTIPGHNLPFDLSGSTLDWYTLTETSRSVLAKVISGSTQQQLIEMNKPTPDLNKIQELEQISLVASELSRDSKNFKSQKKMIKIINDYSNYTF